jgi:SlyX protein
MPPKIIHADHAGYNKGPVSGNQTITGSQAITDNQSVIGDQAVVGQTATGDHIMESRLTNLETKVAFQDDLLESLNRIVAEQQRQIDMQQEQIRLLYDQLRSLAPSHMAQVSEEERPPHY